MVDLPRAQTGANPQHLIVTLLGDYWFGRTEHLPSAGLVALVGEFGITAASGRAALSRLGRRGLLASSKRGRQTSYGLTPRAEQVLADGRRRIMGFGAGERSWDGAWRVVVFTVPEDRRDARHLLRTRLRWLGFAPLHDGVWVAPRAEVAAASAVLDEVGVANASVLTSRFERGSPLEAWNLDQLRARYEAFVAEFTPYVARATDGAIGAAEALVARTRVMDEWREFPNLDPELPDGALPDGWPRQAARQVFAQAYDLLGQLAELRVRQLLAADAPDLARRVHHHTTSDAR